MRRLIIPRIWRKKKSIERGLCSFFFFKKKKGKWKRTCWKWGRNCVEGEKDGESSVSWQQRNLLRSVCSGQIFPLRSQTSISSGALSWPFPASCCRRLSKKRKKKCPLNMWTLTPELKDWRHIFTRGIERQRIFQKQMLVDDIGASVVCSALPMRAVAVEYWMVNWCRFIHNSLRHSDLATMESFSPPLHSMRPPDRCDD